MAYGSKRARSRPRRSRASRLSTDFKELSTRLEFWQPDAIEAIREFLREDLIRGCVVADVVGSGKTWIVIDYLLASLRTEKKSRLLTSRKEFSTPTASNTPHKPSLKAHKRKAYADLCYRAPPSKTKAVKVASKKASDGDRRDLAPSGTLTVHTPIANGMRSDSVIPLNSATEGTVADLSTTQDPIAAAAKFELPRRSLPTRSSRSNFTWTHCRLLSTRRSTKNWQGPLCQVQTRKPGRGDSTKAYIAFYAMQHSIHSSTNSSLPAGRTASGTSPTRTQTPEPDGELCSGELDIKEDAQDPISIEMRYYSTKALEQFKRFGWEIGHIGPETSLVTHSTQEQS
ncbi:MAG: hypothetical protein M1830_003035 [Pleopsidium flavum]|nr:MAG: hypothetical protein M1830_003035 [Pleopsidium flavum]